MVDLNDGGIIPAYAGNTSGCPRRNRSHRGSSPHTRGTPDCYARSACRCGDHPRIRGEHARHAREIHHEVGIIPAYAGSTLDPSSRVDFAGGSSPHTRGAPCRAATGRPSPRDHPRIRGEHHAAAPLLRPVAGIIPAYAGSTDSFDSITDMFAGSSPHTRGALRASAQASAEARDHPRIRGEHESAHGIF